MVVETTTDKIIRIIQECWTIKLEAFGSGYYVLAELYEPGDDEYLRVEIDKIYDFDEIIDRVYQKAKTLDSMI